VVGGSEDVVEPGNEKKPRSQEAKKPRRPEDQKMERQEAKKNMTTTSKNKSREVMGYRGRVPPRNDSFNFQVESFAFSSVSSN